MLKVAVFVSGGGTDLQSILDACEAKQINAEVKLVISNRKSAYGLERARIKGIKAEWIKDEDEILKRLHEEEIDLVEHKILPKAVGLFADNKVKIDNERVFIL